MQIAPFRLEETHGILSRPENRLRTGSEALGWNSLYASTQREMPYEGLFPGVNDQLIVLHMDGPVAIDRLGGAANVRRIVPAGGIDEDPGHRPIVHIFVKYKAPWHEISDDLPRFDEAAPDSFYAPYEAAATAATG